MRVITRDEFVAAAARDPKYYGDGHGLWLSRVAHCANLASIVTGSADQVLEIGPYLAPLVPGCAIMDKRDWGVTGHRLILHDASRVPWPCADRHFRLVVATAVWEHLHPDKAHACHEAAWRELERVTDYVVWLVPFRWTRHATEYHNGIDLDTISRWTCGRAPLHAATIGTRPGWQCYAALYDLVPYRSRE